MPAADRPARDFPLDALSLPACAADGDGAVVAAYLLDPAETAELHPRPEGLPAGEVRGPAPIGPGPCPGTAAISFSAAVASGIDGNENVWILGAVGWSSPEGATVDAVRPEDPLAGSIAAMVLRDRDR